MGLNCSHGAFDGSYGLFKNLRDSVLEAIGGKSIGNGYIEIPDEFSVGIVEFLTHSDCDGYISAEMCEKVAYELENDVLPLMVKSSELQRDLLVKFINGCKLASKNNEKLMFF